MQSGNRRVIRNIIEDGDHPSDVYRLACAVVDQQNEIDGLKRLIAHLMTRLETLESKT